MSELPTPQPVPPLTDDLAVATGEYEYRVITIPRGVPRSQVSRMLTDHAEYGYWELARMRLFVGGRGRVWLRRRIIRVSRSV